MKTLIIYDISDDGRRTKLFKFLKNKGYTHVQYSAFLAEISGTDIPFIAEALKKYVNDETDAIFVVPLCARCLQQFIIISKRDIIRGNNLII